MSGGKPAFSLSRRLVAEALGTAALVAAVVGSGIMAAGLTGDTALALLANTIATASALIVLIALFGPISGAHLNPAVTMVFALRGEMPPREAALYGAAQIAGGLLGTMLAHAMFAMPLVAFSTRMRTGGGQWLSEGVAAFGLVVTILVGLRLRSSAIPWLVGLYIAAAYWFTASTSFANPAVAVARALTDSFSGIRPLDLPGFIVAECVGAILAAGFVGWLFKPASTITIPSESGQQA